MLKTTRRQFLKLGMAAAGGALTASMVEIPLFTGQNSSLQTQLSNSNSQLANLKKQLDTMTGLVSLSITEQALLEPVVETIIPTDSTGVGGKPDLQGRGDTVHGQLWNHGEPACGLGYQLSVSDEYERILEGQSSCTTNLFQQGIWGEFPDVEF